MAIPDNQGFEYAVVLRRLETVGFRWPDFQAVFPFGFLGIREKEYLELVKIAAVSLQSRDERSLLFDMLDMQWVTYLEQLWVANELGGNQERFAGECHFADARLVINDKVRVELELGERKIRQALRNQDEEWSHLAIFLAGLAACKDDPQSHP